ncbi:MAG: DNA replication/repair protein RecF [Hyphomicrobiales bacterium]
MTHTGKLALTRLTLTDFRNYAGLRLEVGGRMVVLTGPNGAGKTNLLEAISLLAPGRGLRGAAFEDLARQGGSGTWAISVEAETLHGPIRLGTGWSGQGEGEAAGQGRLVLIDGHVQKGSGALAQFIRVLWLTPAMDRLFAGPASDRRRFLDRLVAAFDPEHAARISVFEKVMRDRNLLLEDPRADGTWLDSLEAHMAEAAIAIAAARLTALEELRRYIAEARETSQFPWSYISLEGEVEALVSAMPAVRAEDEYRRLLCDSRRQDRGAGRTLSGPHRSDLAVTHGPKSMPAGLCSTGEQKALLIGLILAQARAVSGVSGIPPLLLLDEVAAHLDRERRHGLFTALAALGCQAWMTGTDVELFADLGRDELVFHVEDGAVSDVKRSG